MTAQQEEEKPPIDPFTNNEELKEKYLQDKRIEFETNCNQNNWGACFSLGEWHQLFGKDFKKATELFRRSCDTGKFGNACFNLAKLYFASKVPDEENTQEKGVEYLETACKYKNSQACGILGSFKLLGVDCKKDIPEAERLFEYACSENDATSCFKLGRLYLDGEKKHNVPRDPTKASIFMKKGCELGHANSCQILAVMYGKGDGVDKNSEISEQYKDLTYQILKQSGERLSK